MRMNEITEAVIGAAIEVHRALGPGLLESAYEECLCRELTLRQVPFERQRSSRLSTKGCNWIVDIASTWWWRGKSWWK